MRLVYGVFSIDYDGRGKTFREAAERLLIVKEDGSVAVHNDKGYRPINYMVPPVELTISENIWKFHSNKEEITLEFERIYSDSNLLMEEDTVKVIKEGTEEHLQRWLIDNLSLVKPSLTFLEREFETGEGPVDLYGLDAGEESLIEVKRTAGGPAVAQINRYLAAYNEKGKKAKGIIVALDFNKRSLTLAKKHGIECLVVPKEVYKHGKHYLKDIPSLLDI